MELNLIIYVVFKTLRWLIIARIVLSFLPMIMKIDTYHPVVRFIHEITEPIMAPFRRLIPPLGGMDFSPIVLFLVLQAVESVVYQLINRI